MSVNKRETILYQLEKLKNTIPKEYYRTLKKMSELYIALGIDSVLTLIDQIKDIPIGSIDDYYIVYKDDLDGG